MSVSVSSARPVRRRWSSIGSATFLLLLCSGITFVGILIVLFLWFVSGRFTIDGAAQLVNWLYRFIDAPYVIRVPLRWDVYVRCLALPLSCSAVEFGIPGLIQYLRLPRRVQVALWMIWILVSALDLWTTYVGTGILTPATDEVRRWIAANEALRGITTVGLTFGPELILSALWLLLRSAFDAWCVAIKHVED